MVGFRKYVVVVLALVLVSTPSKPVAASPEEVRVK